MCVNEVFLSFPLFHVGFVRSFVQPGSFLRVCLVRLLCSAPLAILSCEVGVRLFGSGPASRPAVWLLGSLAVR